MYNVQISQQDDLTSALGHLTDLKHNHLTCILLPSLHCFASLPPPPPSEASTLWDPAEVTLKRVL